MTTKGEEVTKKQYTITIDPVEAFWQNIRNHVYIDESISWFHEYSTDEDPNITIKFQVTMPKEGLPKEEIMKGFKNAKANTDKDVWEET